MKVMQINLWMGRMAKGLMRYIEKEQPDVICMQEVSNADFEVMLPDRMFDILSRIKEASGLEYEYFSPRYSIDVAGGTAPFGNAILSRFPFESTKTVQIEHSTVEHVTAENYQHNVNNLQVVTLVEQDTVWTIANNHGHHELEPLGNDESVAAMHKIAETLRRTEGPLVLCGDLNVVAESRAMRVFDDWMDDIVSHSGAITTLARLNIDRDVVCDHILVNNSVEVKSFKVDDVVVSDHYPLVAELEVKG